MKRYSSTSAGQRQADDTQTRQKGETDKLTARHREEKKCWYSVGKYPDASSIRKILFFISNKPAKMLISLNQIKDYRKTEKL